jgi:hypothetical protein
LLGRKQRSEKEARSACVKAEFLDHRYLYLCYLQEQWFEYGRQSSAGNKMRQRQRCLRALYQRVDAAIKSPAMDPADSSTLGSEVSITVYIQQATFEWIKKHFETEDWIKAFFTTRDSQRYMY